MTEQQNPALYAPKAEKSVLGAILLDPQHLVTLLVDEHLQPEHFADPGLAAIYRAAMELHDADRPIDHLTVTARLADTGQLETAGGAHNVEALATWVPVTGNAREYGRIVREHHQARQLLSASRQIQVDVLAREAPIETVLEHADQLLADIARDGRHGQRQHTWTPEQLRDWMLDELGAAGEPVWATPFPLLNDLLGGGMTRGELMLVAAEEKIGKSHLIDHFLEKWADDGLRAHLYVNEGGKKLRLRRFITRATGIPTQALKNRDLTGGQMRQAVEALNGLKVGITDCSGWTAPEIVRDIKRHRWDVCGVDILHNISKTEPGVEGWDQIGHELRLAPAQADCAMLVAAHLKKRNTVGHGLDIPVLDDIRDSGMFAKLADQVLFVAREKDSDGVLTNDGVLALSAVRDGEPGLVGVTFQSSRLRFLPALPKPVRGDQWRPSNPDAWIESGGGEIEVAEGVRF